MNYTLFNYKLSIGYCRGLAEGAALRLPSQLRHRLLDKPLTQKPKRETAWGHRVSQPKTQGTGNPKLRQGPHCSFQAAVCEEPARGPLRGSLRSLRGPASSPPATPKLARAPPFLSLARGSALGRGPWRTPADPSPFPRPLQLPNLRCNCRDRCHAQSNFNRATPCHQHSHR